MEINNDLVAIKLYRFKCVRCNLIYSEIDLLKDHYFDKHIFYSTINNTFFRSNSEIKIKRRKIEVEKEEISEIDKRLSELNEEAMKKFNLDNIDETEFVKEIGDGVYNKKRELVAGRIAWVQWRNFMWPAKIMKATRHSNTSFYQSSLKIHIRFYEMNHKFGNLFKIDASKCELFYKCKEHEQYKVLGAMDPKKRKEFYISYTHALNDYMESNAKIVSNGLQIKKEKESSIKMGQSNLKYHILETKYTIQEIKELASKSYSNEQYKENAIRELKSKNLLNLITGDDCKNYLLSIITDLNPIKCCRHDKYLNADAKTRREVLNFNKIGPLTQEDSIKTGTHLIKICKDNFVNKPLNLTNYEFDVLYPEVSLKTPAFPLVLLIYFIL